MNHDLLFVLFLLAALFGCRWVLAKAGVRT